MQKIAVLCLCIFFIMHGDNQTTDLTPVLLNRDLPFTVDLKLADVQIPGGIHSAAEAQCGCEYLFITGRTNGLHGFDNGVPNDNFPPSQQNTNVIVVNPRANKVYVRSLHDPLSGLTQQQIDTLSVTSPQSYQCGNTLYITGGYGIDTESGSFSTKPVLTAINVSGLIQWVKNPACSKRASQYIRQISDPIFQVTGGQMYQYGKNPTLLIFGQNFTGYYTSSSNGEYTQQVRRFCIIDNGKCLGVRILPSTPQDPNYRRRDLNVVPIVKIKKHNKKVAAYLALSGVFTVSGGAWTVPVNISANGCPFMQDPNLPTTFKQGMNNYICPHAELLSKTGSMYTILFGGITYEFFQDNAFAVDAELPFTNNVTVVKRNKCGVYKQYFLHNTYPVIISTQSNPGNTLLFGAGGRFVPACGVSMYSNGVINLEKIEKPTTIGYIIGGIMSTVPNTSGPSDTAASPYVFKVILSPNC